MSYFLQGLSKFGKSVVIDLLQTFHFYYGVGDSTCFHEFCHKSGNIRKILFNREGKFFNENTLQKKRFVLNFLS